MSEYNQTRSFNLGIAQETSVEAALIYDDLAYAEQVVGRGNWFFRSYEQLLRRLPIMSERTARNAINQLEAGGWIEKKLKKVNDKPTCHYRIGKYCRMESAKTAETKQSAKTADSIYNNSNTTKKPSASDSNFGAELPTPKAPAPHVAELLAKIIQIVNPNEKVIKTRLTMLNARLKEYTSDEITLAARAFSKSEWHKENKQMSIDNLLAPSKFGRWFTEGKELSANDIPLDRETIDDKLRKEREEIDKNANKDWGFGDAPK